jgi:hypothetical protein
MHDEDSSRPDGDADRPGAGRQDYWNPGIADEILADTVLQLRQLWAQPKDRT